MPRDPRRFTQRRIQVLFGILLAGILYFELSDNEYEPVLTQGAPVVYAEEVTKADTFEHLIRHEPLKALEHARERLIRESLDYTCTFVKQESIGGSIRAEQEIEVKFRPSPHSVVMHWLRNAGLAQRVIYVRGKWQDDDAESDELRPQAVCQPGNGLSLIVPSVKQPINGSLAKKSSRRSIDEFGFLRTLDLLVKYCRIAKERDELQLTFKGETRFDGRPVWVVRRHLPYDVLSSQYPDRTADIYIDKEYQVAVAVYCFSDDSREPRKLLGKYEYRNIRFGVGLTDNVFDPATYGM